MTERPGAPAALVGDGLRVPCIDGIDRTYLSFDTAASTGALPAVAARVHEFLPWYSSVHRGAGWKSQRATAAYEDARRAAMRFAGRPDSDVAIVCRNTTEAINHLAYRLDLDRDDVVVSTVVEHHANLLPWGRVASRRYVECDSSGVFGVDDVVHALKDGRRPRLLAITGGSNVTGWMPPIDEIVVAAHEHGVPVVVDGAQLAPHRPLPRGADYVVWSGHKMYAPFGAGILVGPRAAFATGDPFLAGGGAVDLVDLDDVVWTEPPDREEAGSPNVIGAVALHAAIDELERLGWDAIVEHDVAMSALLRAGLRSIPGVRLLGAVPDDSLPVVSFTVDGVHHALVAARLSVEFGIGVRHGCFCAHPYLLRLLAVTAEERERFRTAVRGGDRHSIPGAVRASAGLSTTPEDVARLLDAVTVIARDEPPLGYEQDPRTGDFWPLTDREPWAIRGRDAGISCARG